MRIDVNRAEADCIINRLDGMCLKTEQKIAEHLSARLKYQFNRDTPRPKYAQVRIRSPRLDAHVKPERKKNWAYHKPRDKKPEAHDPTPKKALTAEQILASI